VTRPPAIRLDDLAAPEFPPEAQPILGMMEEFGLTLTLAPEPLMAAAVDQTGLTDFGPSDFEPRLALLCQALTMEAGLAPWGVTNLFGMLVGLLRNRLLIEDAVRRHPEILAIPVERPIVICGLPRTGTTHLHNLMAADASLRSLPYWESLEPVLPGAAAPAPGAPDPRIARTADALGIVNTVMPEFKRMHEMTVDHVHEEIQLLAIDMSTMLFETMAPIPSWRDAYLTTDQTPMYGYLKKVLQVMQWARGGTRWVLKSPQHIEQFGPLLATFPDATFVVTHRDPVAVTTSVVTMLAYTARFQRRPVEPEVVGRYWADRVEQMLAACVRDRDLLPAAQTIDVHFDEFMADDVAMVERIGAVAGHEVTPAARAAMDAFMADHPRGRHGGVIYDLGQFGLDRDERRRALQFYVDHFGIRTEAD